MYVILILQVHCSICITLYVIHCNKYIVINFNANFSDKSTIRKENSSISLLENSDIYFSFHF